MNYYVITYQKVTGSAKSITSTGHVIAHPPHTTGQIRGARGSRPFKLVNEIMSLTKVGIYALGVTKIH